MLAVFAWFELDILQDHVKAGIDQARKDGLSNREITKRLGGQPHFSDPLATSQEASLVPFQTV